MPPASPWSTAGWTTTPSPGCRSTGAARNLTTEFDGIAKPRPLATHGVDAHHFAPGLGERSSGIAGREADVANHPRLSAVGTFHFVNDARADRADEAQRIADGNHEFAGAERRRIAVHRDGEVGGFDLQRGQIATAVMLQDARGELAAVPEIDARRMAADDVSVGDNHAVGGPNDPRSGALASRAYLDSGLAESLRYLSESFHVYGSLILAQ
jgi:hypothetical protein